MIKINDAHYEYLSSIFNLINGAFEILILYLLNRNYWYCIELDVYIVELIILKQFILEVSRYFKFSANNHSIN